MYKRKKILSVQTVLISAFSAFIFGLLLNVIPSGHGQSLSPEEQKKLLEQVRELSQKVEQMEKKNGGSGSGLKTTDMNNSSFEEKNAASIPAGAGRGEQLSPQQRSEIMEQLKKLKEQTDANNKALEKLLNDEDL